MAVVIKHARTVNVRNAQKIPLYLLRLLPKQRPVKQSLCGSLRRDAHWKNLILTVLIAGCLATIAWCRLAVFLRAYASSSASSSSSSPSSSSSTSSSSTSSSSISSLPSSSPAPLAASQTYYSVGKSGRQDPDSPCDEGYVYIPVAFVIMLYLVYLVECWHSHTRIELQYKVDINTVYDKIRDMRDGVPIIWWKAICYHYVRRTRQVTRYRNGDAFTSTQVYYERINTCTAGSAFNFTQCGVKDISRSLVGLENYPATKIRFSKGFSFASVDSEYEFEDQRSQFFQEYEARDDYMEGREGMDILNVNFKEYMIAFADPANLPWYVSHLVFWVASFLLLSWPLRVIIEYRTAHLYYHVHKLFGANYVDSQVLRGRMSRVSTMNSAEMEMNIRNNNFMVPSYSDALLMNAVRRASVMSVMTTSGGLRHVLGSATPRSGTIPAIHNSGSGTFIPGSLPSIPMTTIRRFHSCTAINQGDKPALVQSRSNVLATLLGLSNNPSEENAANQRMDRRRWRRKRPMSSITFSGSILGTILPATPETSEGYLMALDSTMGSTIVTHFVASGDSVTSVATTKTFPNVGEGETSFSAPMRLSRLCAGGMSSVRNGVLPVRSSQSMTLTHTLNENVPACSSNSEAPPPAYNEALRMPRLHRSGSHRLRLLRTYSQTSSGTANRDCVRPRLQHSESVRLFSGRDRPMVYRSVSQEPRNPLPVSLSVDSCHRMTHSFSQGFDGRSDQGRLSMRDQESGRIRLQGPELVRNLSCEDSSHCQDASSRGRVGADRFCRIKAFTHHTMDDRAAALHAIPQGFRTSDTPNLRGVIQGNSCVPLRQASGARGANPTSFAPVSSPYMTLDLDESKTCPNRDTASRSAMDTSRIPLRLPAVRSAYSALSDDEDTSPERDFCSLLSLTGSSTSLARSETWRSARGNDGPTPLSSSPLLVSPGERESGTVPLLQSGASASTHLLSASSAQRCYDSVQCMETSL